MPFFGMMPQMNPGFMMPTTSTKNSYSKEFTSIESYKDIEEIKKKFPACASLNDANLDPDSLRKAEFYIIRSTNDDDLHKAIKYGIWASSYRNNQALHHAFMERRRENVPIYLFFTVVTSDQYTGVAQMVSDVEFSKSFNYWWEESKWTGIIQIKWLYIKDIHYDQFAKLREGDKSVTALRDGTRLSFENGVEMLRGFKETRTTSSIFDAFNYMDSREEHLRMERDFSAMLHKSYSDMMGINQNEQGGSHGQQSRREGGHDRGYKKSHGGRRRHRAGDNYTYQKKEKSGATADRRAQQSRKQQPASQPARNEETSDIIIKRKRGGQKKQKKARSKRARGKKQSEDEVEYMKKEDLDKQDQDDSLPETDQN